MEVWGWEEGIGGEELAIDKKDVVVVEKTDKIEKNVVITSRLVMLDMLLLNRPKFHGYSLMWSYIPSIMFE